MRDLLEKWYERSQQIAPVRIAGLDRKRLILHFAEAGYTVGAEIGVDRGRFSEYMCQNIPGLHLNAVDPWHWRLRGESRFQSAVRRLTPYHVNVIRETSVVASLDIPDGSLDFVYIDGDHTFDFVMTDIILWAKKVRLGGVVAGHDYYRFRGGGVVAAVDIYTREHGIDKWFLTDERTPTWFWLKTDERFELDQK